MGKIIEETTDQPRLVWDQLEEWVRGQVQQLIQTILEEEVTQLLGRQKSQRRQAVDTPPAYRNGHGKERKLTLSCGTVRVRRPRVRGLEERFESRVLPFLARRTQEVDRLLPELYLHGLAAGDFDLALRGLLGEEAPVSASTVARLKEKWQGEEREWKQRRLEGLEVVYLWADGVYVKAGLEKNKAALLVIVAGLSDGQKVLLAVEPGYRESTESWSTVLRDLKNRGLNCPKLVAGDGNLGLWGALRNVYPAAAEQRCWNHKILNVLDRLPKEHRGEGKCRLRQIASAGTEAQAELRRATAADGCRQAVQEGGQCHGGNLEDVAVSRAEVPSAKRAGAHEAGIFGRPVPRRRGGQTGGAPCCLRISTPIDGTSYLLYVHSLPFLLMR